MCLKVLTNIYIGMACIGWISTCLEVNRPRNTYHQANEHVYPSNDAENLLWALGQYPRSNEVVHPERIDVAEVDGCERLGCFVSMAVCEITIYRNSDKP